MMRGPRLEFVTKAVEQYGDVVHVRAGSRRLFFLRHPDHVDHVLVGNPDRYAKGLGLDEARFFLGDGLLTSSGKQWHEQRSRVHGLFASARLERHLRIAGELTEATLDGWASDSQSHEVQLARDLNRLTMSISASGLLGVEVEDPDEVVDAFETAERKAVKEMVRLVRLPKGLSLRRAVAWRRARAAVDRGCSPVIRAIEAGGADAGVKAALSSGRELRDQVVTLLLTGHETTTAAVLWSLILLGRNPDVARAIHSEVDRESNTAASPADFVPRMKLVRMLVAESLRLYPPVWMISRRATAPDRIGPYVIPEGSQVLISPYVVHRHPDFWPEPERFDIERFRNGTGNRIHRSAYIPFGLGPRGCVGARLGMSEVVLILAMTLHRYSVTVVQEDRITTDAQLALHPTPRVRAIVRAR